MKKKSEIEYYEPPRDIVEITEKRTMDIVRVWGYSPKNTIGQLATSLYLQGMEDVVRVQLRKK